MPLLSDHHAARPVRPPPHRRSSVVAAIATLVLPAMLAAGPAAGADVLPSGTSEAPIVLEAVVVTATRHAMLGVEAPAALSVVTRRDIEARGADNVLDAVRGEPGLSLQGRSIGGRKVLSIRGMDSKHTLFLVDGRRVGASDGVIGHSDFQYDWIAIEDIERIEVVRGPMSVLYGSEAMGGVVNIITREPGDRWRLGANVEGVHADGGRGGDGHRLGVRADGPIGGGFFFRAGAAQSRIGALASPADPRISELEGRDKQDGWLGLGWRGREGHRLDFEHREGREERSANARERSGQRRYHQTFNDIDRSLTSLGWGADWALAGAVPALTTQLRAYRARIDVENRRTAGVAINPLQVIEDRVLEGQARLTLGAHDLTGGFEARDESLADPGLPNGRSVAAHRALFLQDEFAVNQGVRLTLGLRHDRHQLFGDEWSPRAYVVWRASPEWTVKGGFSHGFKAPNLKQIVPGGRAEGPNTFLGNPDLRPERSDGIELGAGYASRQTQAQVMVFDQRIDDLIEVRLVAAGAVPGVGTYTYENLSKARLRGVETGLAHALGGGWIAQFNVNYLDARNGAGQRLDRRPRHNATVRLDWNEGPWRAGAHAEYSAGQQLPAQTAGAPSQPVPGVTLFGAHVSHAWPSGLQLGLGVQNLGDVRLADKSPLFTHVEPPRTWRLTLRGRW